MQEPLFTIEMLGNRIVHIVGQGSLGSALFQNLFRMGVRECALWDNDRVEARNRFNQRVFEIDIGQKKVHAQARIAEMIEHGSSASLQLHDARVELSTKFSNPCIVIAAVDSMLSREIILNHVEGNPNVTFFIDGRVGMDGGKVYGLDPNNAEHIARYRDPIHMHADPAQVEQACKTEFPMPSTADIVAGHMLWRLARWLQLEQGCMDPYDNFVGFCFVPYLVQVTEQWDQSIEDSFSTTQKVRWKLTEFFRRLFYK